MGYCLCAGCTFGKQKYFAAKSSGTLLRGLSAGDSQVVLQMAICWLILEIIFAVIVGMLLIEGLERGRWYLSQRRWKRR